MRLKLAKTGKYRKMSVEVRRAEAEAHLDKKE
jgi:hypothetical protein